MSNKSQVKVFCKDCIYIRKLSGMYEASFECAHHDNKEIIESFYESMEHIKWTPKNKNSRNDCPLHVHKDTKKDKSKRGLLSIFTLGKDEGKLSLVGK